MDEQKVNQTLNNATAAASNGAAGQTATSASETTVKPKFAYEDPELTAHINSMYDAYGNARRTALQEAGDQALSDAQANRDKIAQQYQTQRNMAAADWERQRRNFMESANMNGLNTGAGGQAQLAMQGRYQQTQNQLGYQQANAEAEADRQMADIKRETQAKINEAVAENDYKRAAALLDQYNVMYSRALEEAKARAAYGDFGGYGTLYGEDASKQMSNMWYAQNPDLAYMMGLITADQRDNLKEKKPMNAARGGGGYYGGGGYSGGGYSGGSGSSYDDYLKANGLKVTGSAQTGSSGSKGRTAESYSRANYLNKEPINNGQVKSSSSSSTPTYSPQKAYTNGTLNLNTVASNIVNFLKTH